MLSKLSVETAKATFGDQYLPNSSTRLEPLSIRPRKSSEKRMGIAPFLFCSVPATAIPGSSPGTLPPAKDDRYAVALDTDNFHQLGFLDARRADRHVEIDVRGEALVGARRGVALDVLGDAEPDCRAAPRRDARLRRGVGEQALGMPHLEAQDLRHHAVAQRRQIVLGDAELFERRFGGRQQVADLLRLERDVALLVLVAFGGEQGPGPR